MLIAPASGCLLLLPLFPKQLDRPRPMSGVVIVGVSVDLEIPRNELPEQRGLLPQVVCSVDDRFIPRRRHPVCPSGPGADGPTVPSQQEHTKWQARAPVLSASIRQISSRGCERGSEPLFSERDVTMGANNMNEGPIHIVSLAEAALN
jgi:hypothetical protein